MIDEAYISFFKALCNDTRLGIVLCLKTGAKNVGQIVSELNMEQSRVSHNLKCLEKNGFVSVSQRGKQRVYTLNKETVSPILEAVKKHIKKHDIKTC